VIDLVESIMKKWKDICDPYAANVRKLTEKAAMLWQLWDNMQWFINLYKKNTYVSSFNIYYRNIHDCR